MKKVTLKSVAALVAVTAVGIVPVFASVIAQNASDTSVTITATVSEAEPTHTPDPIIPSVSYKLGDVNRDGEVNLDDTLIILGAALGVEKEEYKLDAEQKTLADYDGDGIVTLDDTMKSLKVAIGVVE